MRWGRDVVNAPGRDVRHLDEGSRGSDEYLVK